MRLSSNVSRNWQQLNSLQEAADNLISRGVNASVRDFGDGELLWVQWGCQSELSQESMSQAIPVYDHAAMITPLAQNWSIALQVGNDFEERFQLGTLSEVVGKVLQFSRESG